MSEQQVPQSLGEIKAKLSTPDGEAFVNDKVKLDAEKEIDVILEMYKIYVTTTTQVSNWRNSANAFFISLNALVLTLVGIFGDAQVLTVIITGIGLIAVNFVWWGLLDKYKRLNDAKFDVIEDFEQLLPVMPFVSREWNHYHANSEKKHKLLSEAEKKIPLILNIIYAIGMILYVPFCICRWLCTVAGIF